MWGAVSWLVLIFLLFFSIGFYRGFSGENTNADLPASIVFILRYSVLILSLAVAAGVLFYERKKYLPPVFSKPITMPKIAETPLVFQPPKITEPPKIIVPPKPIPEPAKSFDFTKPPIRPSFPLQPPTPPQITPKVFGAEPQPFWPKEPEKKSPPEPRPVFEPPKPTFLSQPPKPSVPPTPPTPLNPPAGPFQSM